MKIYNAPLYFNLKEILEQFIIKDYNALLKKIPYIFIVPNKNARNLCKTLLSELKFENNISVFSISDNKELLKLLNKYAGSKYLKDINSLINAQIISYNKRNSIITSLIQHSKANLSLDEYFILSKNLSHLIDIISAENISIDKIPQPNIYSSYTEIIVKLLNNITKNWNSIIKEMNYYNILEFKAQVFNLLANIVNDIHNIKIVIFGIDNYSSSIIKFLHTIANHKHGAVIMHGIDFNINNNEWINLLPSHPQYINSQILKKLNINRKNISNIINTNFENKSKCNTITLKDDQLTTISFNQLLNSIFNIIPHKFILKSNIHNIQNNFTSANITSTDKSTISFTPLHNISYMELNDESEEANLIVQTIKQKLKSNPNQEITIITSSYFLSKRISFLLKKENINYINLLANNIKYTLEFSFFNLITNIDINNLNFINLLSLLKHNLCIFSQNIKLIQLIDLYIAREIIPNKTLLECKEILAKCCKQKKITEEEYNDISNILNTIEELYSSFNLLNKDTILFTDILSIHMELAEKLSIKGSNNTYLIWENSHGFNFKDILQQIKEDTASFPKVTLQNYNILLNLLLNEYYIPINLNQSVNVKICGFLQARYTDNIIFLSDLNEGSFPIFKTKEIASISYLLKQLDLPTSDEDIGKQAFIFMQLCHCKQVYLTRSKKKQGILTTPSRFIIKLQNILKANNLKFNNEEFIDIIHNSKLIEQNHITNDKNPYNTKNTILPSTNPEVKYRPKHVKITSIETLLKNPYIFFIENILNFNILPSINIDFDAKLRGILTHQILETFANYIKKPNHAAYEIKDLETILEKVAKEKFDLYINNYPKSKLSYYIFKYYIPDLAKYFYKEIKEYTDINSEVNKILEINFNEETVKISGRADYISRSEEKVLIIDFKTGSIPYSKIDIETFRKQLIILGYIDLATNKQNISKKYNLSYYFIPNNFYDKMKTLSFMKLFNLSELNKYIEDNFEKIKSSLKNFLLTKQEFTFNVKYKDIPSEYKHFSRIDDFNKF